MRWNIVELSENGRYAKLSRGFLCVMDGDEQLGKVIIDEMCCLLLTAEQAVLSKPLMVRLAEYGIPIVICGENYHPISINLPYAAHHQPNRALDLQLSATEPLKKRLWQQIVKRKIENQANTLKQLHPDESSVQNQFSRLTSKVRSGDPENIEAQAAKLYWKTIVSGGFTRNNASQDTLNAALNYGYTVIRAACARAIVAAGLLPALGIYHSNQRNAFCLADDLMEPYRPLVDYEVFNTGVASGELDKHAKQKLAKLLLLDIEVDGKNTIVNNAMQMLAFSYVNSLKDKTPQLSLPKLE
ncbi:MAG: subtype II CRISPR-associated endonuclease Cas1 [Spirochaetales bacterium]|nr:MAG: subtype II CRISPR-associated endonuclease Cas1 [Spirochaetales bacterium]